MSFFEKAKKFTGSLRDKITAFLAGKRWKNSDSHITDTKQNPEIRKTCDMEATKTRDMNSPIEEKNGLETSQSRLKHFVSVKRDTAQSVKRDMLLTAGNIGSGTPSAEVANRPSGLVPLVPSVSTDEGSREPKVQKGHAAIAGNIGSGACPYCQSKDFVKRGTRQKAKERVQLYLCRNCRRTFTPFAIKGKSYSLPVIIDAISYYNIGFSFEQTAKVLKEKQAVDIQPTTVANWYEEYRGMCAYARMRPFAVKEYSPYNVVETATLAHRQLYRFRFHKAKAKLIIKESYRHYHLKPMAEFLALVPSECPHQYFQEGLRASEAPLFFSKKEMIVRSKQNYATKMAGFAVPAASDNKQRHETLQKFMLFNDSVTVATEVPVYLTREDLAHMRTQLGFEVYRPAAEVARSGSVSHLTHPAAPIFTKVNRIGRDWAKRPATISAPGRPAADIEAALLGQSQSDAGPKRHAPKSYQLLQRDDELPKLITGHIDFIQIRNGSIHILDYKPNAAKEKPIEQLTLYALALSRLTGLRLFEFKCAWFDEKNYFEFFPLHVVYKRKRGKSRKQIRTKEGIYDINQRMDKVERMETIEV
ncbi:MAG: PD-(D/E)XK nuclease family protein [Candidatus Nealsonbacteria bacterium]|nr:PD-(D/E)XK nuclease family protein [Candidatus Nealsonbacteria bacterium]